MAKGACLPLDPVMNPVLARLARLWPARDSLRNRPPNWSAAGITDPWFRDHFEYATAVVSEWLGQAMPLERARVMDFGCGDGITGLGVALKHGPRQVLGIDVTQTFRRLSQVARAQIGLARLPYNLHFERISPGEPLAGRHSIDAIFSWSAFEHIERPYLVPVIADLFACLPSAGLFFLQIDPLYYSPFGSHLGRFVAQPWAHLLWDAERLSRAVLEFEGDIPDAEKEINFLARPFGEYKAFIFEEYLKLNRVTADEIIALFVAQGFEVLREARTRTDLVIPAALAARYPEADLATAGIQVLFRKP